ncbi:MAG: hypothetical protein RSA70_04600, partial [Clostridia bacterium]
MSFSLPKYTAVDFSSDIFKNAPNATLIPAPRDGAAPDDYHATTIFPEYFKIEGEWHLAEESRMDSVAVWNGERILVAEFRALKEGDLIVCGRTEDGSCGIFVHTNGFECEDASQAGAFAFRTGRSRETAYSRDYDELYELMRYERENGGHVVFVMGPACTFDHDSRNGFSKLVEAGYVGAILAGNALATHDLEAAYYETALGQHVYTQESFAGGHYNHIDTINRVRRSGSIPKFIEEYNIKGGIIASAVKAGVPLVLAGSIRDDGPLPEVIADAYEAQSAMREQISKATVVVCIATTLHSIAAGNMTPSYRVING